MAIQIKGETLSCNTESMRSILRLHLFTWLMYQMHSQRTRNYNSCPHTGIIMFLYILKTFKKLCLCALGMTSSNHFHPILSDLPLFFQKIYLLQPWISPPLWCQFIISFQSSFVEFYNHHGPPVPAFTSIFPCHNFSFFFFSWRQGVNPYKLRSWEVKVQYKFSRLVCLGNRNPEDGVSCPT